MRPEAGSAPPLLERSSLWLSAGCRLKVVRFDDVLVNMPTIPELSEKAKVILVLMYR